MRKEGATESRLHRVHQKLSQIMNQAVDDGLVAKNPCSPISIPRPKPKDCLLYTSPPSRDRRS